MTNIRILEKENRKSIEIKGHAGYGKAGEDIVCAGISTLAFTLLNFLEHLKEMKLIETIEYIQKEGYLFIEYDGKSKESEDAFEVIKTGFRMLQQNYEKFISLSGGNVEKESDKVNLSRENL